MQKGTRLSVFDDGSNWGTNPHDSWNGRDQADNEQFWKPATVQRIYRRHRDRGDYMVDVLFDHRPLVSYGHFLSLTRHLPEAKKSLDTVRKGAL